MKRINIFCFIAKTGSGKTKYINSILEDKKFMEENNLSLLVYGTTRSKREKEVDGIDYYFHSNEEFKNIPKENLVEFRSYYTLNDGEIFYFTKSEYFNKEDKNIICVVSPYQYESYKKWVLEQNLNSKITDSGYEYNLKPILINTDLKIRINRLMDRAKKDEDIYEMCRRVMQEKMEFESVEQHNIELVATFDFKTNCIIDNNSSKPRDIKKNINKIKEFIRNNYS